MPLSETSAPMLRILARLFCPTALLLILAFATRTRVPEPVQLPAPSTLEYTLNAEAPRGHWMKISTKEKNRCV